MKCSSEALPWLFRLFAAIQRFSKPGSGLLSNSAQALGALIRGQSSVSTLTIRSGTTAGLARMAVSFRSAVLLITVVLGLQLATASAPAGQQIRAVAPQQSLSLIAQGFSDLYELLTHDSDRSAEAPDASEAAIARSKVAEDAAAAERYALKLTSLKSLLRTRQGGDEAHRSLCTTSHRLFPEGQNVQEVDF